MQRFAIIVAGGSGSRMGSSVPKQFLLLAGKPVLMHTLERFRSFDTEMKIILVLPSDQQQYWKELCANHEFRIPHQTVNGGETRFHSVKNGLEAISGSGIVAIHDGVRPCVSSETLTRVFSMAEEKGNAIPVMPVVESLREQRNGYYTAVDRSNFISIQTPQCFNTEIIRKAFEQPYRPEFTDDASVAEAAGYLICTTAGNPENIKITGPQDLRVAELFIAG